MQEKTINKHYKQNRVDGEFVVAYDHSLKKETLKELDDIKLKGSFTLNEELDMLKRDINNLMEENEILRNVQHEQNKKINELETLITEFIRGEVNESF